MTTPWRRIGAVSCAILLLWLGSTAAAGAVELKVSRDALERTLKQQLFSGPNGRYYLKGSDKSACFVYAEDAKLQFVNDHGEDRIVVHMKTHARMGKAVSGVCVGITLALPAEVSLAPIGDGESVGFRDARIDRVREHQE